MEDDDSNQQQQKRPPPSHQQQASPRRIMIVADPTRESSDALQYAISHALVSGDEVILIHVIITPPSQSIALATLSVLQNKRYAFGNFFWKSPPASPRPQNNNQNSTTTTSGSSSSSSTNTAPTASSGGSGGGRLDHVYLSSWNALSSLFVKFEHMAVGSVAAACSPRDHVQGCGGSCGVSPGDGSIDFLEAMKKDCEDAFPCMKVKIEKVNSGTMDKASVILFKSMELEIDLLIIGQRRSMASALLGPRKAITIPGAKGGGSGVKTVDTAEYLIEHSECTCVGVQKKAQNAGYLINTKTRKNFWLLA